MPKFAANLSMMFNEYDFCDRFEQAALCGFKAVEFASPYEIKRDLLKNILKETHLKLVLFNTRCGDDQHGFWGNTAVPGCEDKALDDFKIALDYACALECKTVHVLAGNVKAGEDPNLYKATLINNLKIASNMFAKYGITLTIEALCPKVKPKYLYKSQYETLDIVKTVNLQNVKLQYDTFHAQLVDGNLTYFLTNYLNYIGHIQVSSVPDRHEPNNGEVCHQYLFKLLDDLGYQGFIGCEYIPLTTTKAGLDWIKPYL